MNNNNDNIKNAKVDSSAIIISSIPNIIGGGFFTGIISSLFIASADSNTRYVLIPFLLCGLAILIKGIMGLIHGIKMRSIVKSVENGYIIDEGKINDVYMNVNHSDKVANRIYVFGFLIFWFGLLIFFDYNAIKTWSEGGSSAFFFSLFFWSLGIYVLVKEFKNKK